MDIEALRTPEGRFSQLAAYPYAARAFDEDGGLRVAYLAEGHQEQHSVLLVHGGPTWSYLWRRVIPSLAEGGNRIVAADLIGFGRSDKPTRARDITAARQEHMLTSLVERLDLQDLVVVVHGWSARIGLALCAAVRPRVKALVTVCPVLGRGGAELDGLIGRLREEEELSASSLVAEGCAAPLAAVVRRAYDAPFEGEPHAAGLRALPSLLPDEEDWREQTSALDLPILAVSGEADRLGSPEDWLAALPAGRVRERVVIAGAGHYVAEDRGPELALAILSFLGRT